MKSIITNESYCLVCGSPYVEWHHIFFGKNRAKADKHKLLIPLCNKHHTGSNESPHKNRKIDLAYKENAQRVFEDKIGDRTLFMQEFGRNYL